VGQDALTSMCPGDSRDVVLEWYKVKPDIVLNKYGNIVCNIGATWERATGEKDWFVCQTLSGWDGGRRVK
jgi:hypothetical protein